MDEFYNKHYIRVDETGRIVKGFSDAFESPEEDDICINEQGGYQFRLVPGGDENPSLRNEFNVLLYKWDGTGIVTRTQQEIEADRPPEPEPEPDHRAFLVGIMEGYSE